MGKYVDSGVTKLAWVPDAGIASVSAPTVAELTAAGVKDLTVATLAGFTLGFTASDTLNEKSVADTGNITDFGRSNYEADFTFFSPDSSDTTSVYYTAQTLFTARNIYGYWVRRIGLPYTTAFATGQKVDVFYVVTDNPQDMSGGDGSQYVKMRVPFGQMSKAARRVSVV